MVLWLYRTGRYLVKKTVVSFDLFRTAASLEMFTGPSTFGSFAVVLSLDVKFVYNFEKHSFKTQTQ